MIRILTTEDSTIYCDAHLEFVHPLEDLDKIDSCILDAQVRPSMINELQPELLFLATCVLPGPNAWTNLIWTLDQYIHEIGKNNWILVNSRQDLIKPGIKTILHIEDLSAIQENLSRIEQLYDSGVRSIGLTHNMTNQFTGGILSEDGLTDLGQEAIQKIIGLGMILDLAHLNEKSLFEITSRFDLQPFISHAGVFGVFPNPRNISDKVLQNIGDRNGFVGIGFAGSFMAYHGATSQNFLEQIEYANRIARETHVGIGSDLGGITSYLPYGLANLLAVKQLEISRNNLKTNLLDYVKNNLD